MRFEIVHRSDRRRLILIFAGWGMDDNVFRGLHHSAYSVGVVWDYTDVKEGIMPELSGYEEICVVAWSFGVYAASRLLDGADRRITIRIAINGTMTPVSDTAGIPERIFKGTLAGMDERNLKKFRRRMCSSAAEYERFTEHLPQRDINNLIEELKAFGDWCSTEVCFRWDRALVGMTDAIFPPEAQIESWKGKAVIEMMERGHLPDFATIIDKYIIDKDLVETRFSRSKDTYTAHAEVQNRMATRLYELSEPFIRGTNDRVLEIGCGTGILTGILTERFAPENLRLWDLADYSDFVPTGARFHKCDAETEIHSLPDNSESIIFSSATIQWFNSSELFLKEVARVLRPGGLAAISTFDPENMAELTEITGIGLSLPSLEQLTMAVEDRMEVIASERGIEIMRFDTPLDVLKHIKATGVSGLATGEGRGALAARKLLKRYSRADDGTYHLTYRPIYLILRKKK